VTIQRSTANHPQDLEPDYLVPVFQLRHRLAETIVLGPAKPGRVDVLVCLSKNIDWLSRWIFPSTFIVFNVIYWSVYLSPPHFHCDLSDYHGIDEPCFQTHDPVFH